MNKLNNAQKLRNSALALAPYRATRMSAQQYRPESGNGLTGSSGSFTSAARSSSPQRITLYAPSCLKGATQSLMTTRYFTGSRFPSATSSSTRGHRAFITASGRFMEVGAELIPTVSSLINEYRKCRTSLWRADFKEVIANTQSRT